MLAGAGHQVTVLTRSGIKPELAGVQRLAADAADPDALTRAAVGMTAIFNCANPAS